MDRCPYDVLQVSPQASDSVIRASYKALIQRYHPDRYTPREEAEALTKELNAAYAILSNPQRRAAYDAQRCAPAQEQATSEPPPPDASSTEEPAGDVRDPAYSFGWKFWLSLLLLYVLVRLLAKVLGVLPALVTLGLVWWAWTASTHRPALIRAGAVGLALLVSAVFTVTLSVAVADLVPPAPSTSASTPHTRDPEPVSVPTVIIDPFAAVVPPPPGSVFENAPDPLAAGLMAMSDEAFDRGVGMWLEAHPDLAGDRARLDQLSLHLQGVAQENSSVTLGAGLDTALRRLLAAEQAQRMTTAAETARATAHRPLEVPHSQPVQAWCPEGTQEQADGATCCERPRTEYHANGGATLHPVRCYPKVHG